MQSDCENLTSFHYPSMTRLSTLLTSSSSASSTSDPIQAESTITTTSTTVTSTLMDSVKCPTSNLPPTSTVTKSSSLFGTRSLWGFKDNLLSGLSSRLEAFQSSFTDNGSTSDPSKSYINNSPLGSTTGSPCANKQRRRPKIRSIFGQPEMMTIPIVQSSSSMQRSKDTSMDSLDTLDSGHSMGGSSCVSVTELRNLEIHDTLKPYRTGESIGIGSGQETSLESSEAEDEGNNDRLRLRIPRRPRGIDLNNLNSNSKISSQSNGQSTMVDKCSANPWTSNCDYNSDGTDDDEEVKIFMENFVDKIFSDR